MKLSKLIYKLSCLLCLIITFLSFLSLFGRYHYFELSTHFRLQYVCLSLICAILFCIFRDGKFLLPCFICIILNGIYIFPYYSAKNNVNNAAKIDLKLMLANVQGHNKNYDGLIQTIKSTNPDIIVLQEITEEWWQQIQTITADYPHFKSVPRAGGSGLALFSRFPIEQCDILTLDSSTHPALFSKINLDGIILSILTIHPPTPTRADKFTNRNEQFTQSALIMKSTPEPKLMIGDLNTTMWSPYFTDLVENSGLNEARKGRGLYPSWHAVLPPFLRIPIDHCLVSNKIEVSNIELGSYTGSDHFPLVINLKIEKN